MDNTLHIIGGGMAGSEAAETGAALSPKIEHAYQHPAGCALPAGQQPLSSPVTTALKVRVTTAIC